MQKRNIKIDIIRGLGILLMIYGHAAKYTSFVALFHMAIFFIASGYCFDEKRVETIGDVCRYVLKKIKTLWIPFFAYETIFVLLHNFFIRINVYTDNVLFLENCSNPITKVFDKFSVKEIVIQIVKNALFQGDTQIGGALWFLQTLFFVTVLYGIVQFIFVTITKNEKLALVGQGIVSVLFLTGGYYCQVYDITAKHLDRAFTCYWMLFFGYCIKKYSVMDRIYKVLNRNVCVVLSVILLIVSLGFGRISLNGNVYPNPFYLIIVSALGWILLYSFAEILQKIEWLDIRLQYISIHSVPIIALHFLAFKVVSAIYIIITGNEWYMLAAYPVLAYSVIWCLLYMIAGLFIPLLYDITIRKLWKLAFVHNKKD